MLMVSPSRLRAMTEDRIESGIETAMMTVLRQLPRKIEDHQRGEAGGDDRLADHSAHRRPHEDGLVGHRLDLELRRECRDHAGQEIPDAAHDVEGGCRACLENRDENAPAAVLTDDVRLGREPVAHVGDVPQIDRRVGERLDREVVQLGDGPRACVHRDVILELADLGGAGRQHDVLLAEGRDGVGRGQPFRLEQALVQIDHHLALLAAVRVRDGRARDRDELSPQEVETDVVELGLGEAGQGELEDRHRRRAVVDDQGRLDAGRELAESGLRYRRHLGIGRIEARVRLQKDLDHRLAAHRRRLDVLDIVHRRRQDALVTGGDPTFHLLRVEAGELPGHRDHRDVDVRKDIGGSSQDNHRAQDEDQERPGR